MQTWTIKSTSGSAADFHARDTDNVERPEIWIHNVHRPALVLGSTQPTSTIDTERAQQDNIEVCKRRSGGGLVRIDPNELWVDVLLPKHSRLWKTDIGDSMLWVGQTWANALQDLLPDATPTVFSGPLTNREIGKVICFGGMGSGEVEIGGYKVVGISQRRTRNLARFQCLVKQRWQPNLLRPYLANDNPSHIPWAALRIGFPPELQATTIENDQLAASFTSRLPTP